MSQTKNPLYPFWIQGITMQIIKQKTSVQNCTEVFFGAPEGTRTPDLLIRSQTLYPAELLAHNCF